MCKLSRRRNFNPLAHSDAPAYHDFSLYSPNFIITHYHLFTNSVNSKEIRKLVRILKSHLEVCNNSPKENPKHILQEIIKKDIFSQDAKKF